MRIDDYLDRVCLFEDRRTAFDAVSRGKVRLNGAPTQPNRDVLPGARILIDLGSGPLDIEVAAMPEDRVAKVEAGMYYRVLTDERGSRLFF